MQSKEVEVDPKGLLLEAYPSMPAEVSFEFELPNGQKLQCKARSLADSSEGDQLYHRSLEVMEVIEKGAVPPSWKQWLPCSPNVAQLCFYISELLIEPKVTMPEALEWAKTRHPLIPTLGMALFEHVVTPVQVAEVSRIEAEKKDSHPIPSREPF